MPAETRRKSAPRSGAELLKAQLERNRALRESHAGDPAANLEMLRRWQVERLSRTYADLRASERYGPAAAFFLSDLYGDRDFTERDRSVERVYPAMVKTMPDSALHTIALAVEVHALSTELDRALWRVLTGELGVGDAFTETRYAEAYRRCDNYAARLRQIELIRLVGEDLDQVVVRPLIYRMIMLARKPAQLAGFGELQDFLERGFTAFRHMGGAAEFLHTVDSREKLILDRIYVGHPKPFDLNVR